MTPSANLNRRQLTASFAFVYLTVEPILVGRWGALSARERIPSFDLIPKLAVLPMCEY